MKIKKGQLIEVDITDVAFGGRGLVRINGLAYRILALQDSGTLRVQRFLRGLQMAIFDV
jgi:hypothetical protein